MSKSNSTNSQSKERKIERAMRKYDLEHLEDTLIRYWSGKGEEQYTLRELETWFNIQVTEQVLRQADEDPEGLGPSPEKVYKALSGSDDVSESEQEIAREQMEDLGIDVEELENDYPSYQSIYGWLKEDKEVNSPETRIADNPDQARKRISKLRSRSEKVGEQILELLQKMDEVESPSASVNVQFTVECDKCGRRVPMLEYMEKGGCETCANSSSGKSKSVRPDSDSEDSEENSEKPSSGAADSSV